MPEQSIAALLVEAKNRAALLSQNLPKVADPAAVSLSAKTPWKALMFRETLFWRTEELARVACDLYEAGQLAAALTITRSCIEGVAACWYLKGLLERASSRRDIAGLDEKLMRLIMGSKNGITDLPAINAMTFIEAVEKDVPGFKKTYESLCEYAHPNWSGTALLFSKNDRERILTELGSNPRNNLFAPSMGLRSLIGSLVAFQHSYNEVGNVLPIVIELCEADINSRQT